MASDEHHDAIPSHQDDGDNVEQSHPPVEDDGQGEDGQAWDTAADTNDEARDGAARDWAGAQDEHDERAASDSNEHSLPKHEEAEQQPTRKTAASRTVPSPVRKSRNQPNWIDEDQRSKDQQMMVPNRQRRQRNEMYRPPQQSMQQQDEKRDDGKNPLKLRLDLNLEVDIELKARIHGDITLALLN